MVGNLNSMGFELAISTNVAFISARTFSIWPRDLCDRLAATIPPATAKTNLQYPSASARALWDSGPFAFWYSVQLESVAARS